MNPAIIVLVLVIAPIILGAGLKWIKAYTEEQERLARRNKQRTGATVASSSPPPAPARGGASDIDRFLQEIDKLRKRDGGAPTTAKPVVAKAVPVTKSKVKAKPPQTAREKANDAVFGTSQSAEPKIDKSLQPKVFVQPTAVTFTIPPSPILNAKMGQKSKPAPTTPFGKNLVGLLANPQSVAMAVVLTEVLGPPKCKQ